MGGLFTIKNAIFLYMKTLKILFCIGLLAFVGCASSEPPAQQRSVNTDEIRANAAKAYSELDAEQVNH